MDLPDNWWRKPAYAKKMVGFAAPGGFPLYAGLAVGSRETIHKMVPYRSHAARRTGKSVGEHRLVIV